MVKNQKLIGEPLLDPKIKVASVCQIMITKSVQCAWVKRMKEGIGKQRMEITSFYLRYVGCSFIFDCDYDLCLLNLSNMLSFYIDIFKAWTEVQGLCKADFHQNSIRRSILWNNKNITIEGKSISWNIVEGNGYERRRTSEILNNRRSQNSKVPIT